MRDLSIKDLVDLVVADVPDGGDRIQKMYDWHFDRVMRTSQWILGIAASLFLSLAVSLFRAELQLPVWQIALVVVGALGTATYGLYRQWQLRSVHRQFVAALKLYCELKEMAPFIARYRGRPPGVEGEQ